MDTKVLAFCYVAEKGLGEIVFTRQKGNRGRNKQEVQEDEDESLRNKIPVKTR